MTHRGEREVFFPFRQRPNIKILKDMAKASKIFATKKVKLFFAHLKVMPTKSSA